ncbi:MAG TPA: FAD:protein FMN transferase [Longimicrobiales bacterium]|nr:FAD:protein FMN transferase [Longimicrobiales bacterium]
MWDKYQPTRRDFLTLAAGAFAVSAVPLARSRYRSRLHTRSLPAMGTVAELAVVHRDERYAQQAMQAALAELHRVEGRLTRFSATSDIGRANSMAGAQRVAISPESALVVQYALSWASASNGGFDPAMARVVDLWDVKHRHVPPAPQQVARLAGRRLYRHIDVDAASVFVREADALIDLGGIACGYGVDRAAAVLREWGINNGYINVGGDIYALGHGVDGEPWRIGVRSPSDPDALITTVQLSDAAIATSGDYEQGYTYRGRRYHHIIDPALAEPRVTATHTVTVVADCCMDADAASTAVFGLTPDAAQHVLALRAPSSRIVATG